MAQRRFHITASFSNGPSLSHSLLGVGVVGGHDLLAVLVVPNTGRRSAVAAALTGTDTMMECQLTYVSRAVIRGHRKGCGRFSKFNQGSSLAAHILHDGGVACRARRTNVPDNFAVNGARDAVLQLEVHLGNGVLGEDGGIGDITCEGEIGLATVFSNGWMKLDGNEGGYPYEWQQTRPCCGW
jgi:hypothetical protein